MVLDLLKLPRDLTFKLDKYYSKQELHAYKDRVSFISFKI